MRYIQRGGYSVLFFYAIWVSGCLPGPTAATQEHSAALLSQTGLYDDITKGTFAAGVRAFTPQFPLWTDGAKKRRWIYLPEGKKIDTSRMDSWVFPVGTRLWKEFSKDGKRIETRLIEKVGEGIQNWVIVSYRWREDQSDAEITLSGGLNEQNTTHDIPSAGQCISCHGGTSSAGLGFSAIQLSHDKSETTLSWLIKTDKLTHPPPKGHFQVPGTPQERSVLGYLHANCGHCHNDNNNNAWMNPTTQKPFHFNLKTSQLASVSQTELYRTGLGAGNHRLIVPGVPEQSALYKVLDRNRMPPVGVEQVDQTMLKAIEQWIVQLKPQPEQ